MPPSIRRRLPDVPVACLLASLAACLGLSIPVARADTSGNLRSAADARAYDLPADNVRGALEDPERPAADRARDAAERVEALLKASGVARGMRVAVIRAGDGYLAQVLAAATYPQGKVWANNDPSGTDEATAKAWDARLVDPSTADIAVLSQPLSEPLPAYAVNVDLAFAVGADHDAAARGIDAAAMHATVARALAPGGRYVVVDARAGAKADPSTAAAACRAVEATVRRQVEAAGLRFVSSSDALASPADRGDTSACGEGRLAADRFVLVFEKPKPE